MKPDTATLLGLMAGLLTTVSFVPQVVRTWKTRSTGDISLVMFITFSAGIALWTVYGFLIQSLPVILTNSITFLLAAAILVMKIRYK